MLTPETKRKIDNCRDTLVGKIPVPMSQIEQITLALTYKFMSDIDEENRELGGASFFEGDFEKYAWKNIMDKRNGAQERLNLYSEGLDSMSRNGNIPDLFRDIFRNAYLPFKDPTTLDRLLKQIDEFHYEHSEELGNAFEYLLSTAGSQGDAGQFRTPRHIIDFLVSVVEPTKDDTILDPACGTAGFLISAYKHILEQNGKNLSIEDKQKISKNISGYDISHDMVRLSLVNMYLHNFADPKIYEYDTLSSEERWHDDFDCILANPPFMTPKGGSQPHKRFSITSTKSEVLFVDYIMEHMKIHGKAGIIVPEGVIFQSGKAYKELRENMVKNNFLWAVVSLPSGVFQPYSGVKTSILFFDRQIAKKTDQVLFVKVSTDGFDLGAQRRVIDKNNLPEAFEILKKYKNGIEKNNEIESILSPLAHLVEKTKIAESGDYNLSAERYKINIHGITSNFEMIELGEIVELTSGSFLPSKNVVSGPFPVYGGNGINNYHNEFLIEDPTIVIGRVGEYCGAVHLTRKKSWITDNALYIKKYLKVVNQDFLVNILRNANLNQFAKQGGQPSISQSSIKELKIPLPPIEIQEQIVTELEGYQRIIDGARAVVENYKPTIKIDPEWEMVEFEKICTLEYGSSLPKEKRIDGPYPVMGSNGISGYHNQFLVPGPGIIVGRKGSAGEVVWEESNFFPIDTTYYIKVKSEKPTDLKFLFFILKSLDLGSLKGGAGIPGLNRNDVYLKYKIPLPSLEIQQSIVDRTEKEQKLIDTTRELIAIYEGKVKERIGEVWGEK